MRSFNILNVICFLIYLTQFTAPLMMIILSRVFIADGKKILFRIIISFKCSSFLPFIHISLLIICEFCLAYSKIS